MSLNYPDGSGMTRNYHHSILPDKSQMLADGQSCSPSSSMDGGTYTELSFQPFKSPQIRINIEERPTTFPHLLFRLQSRVCTKWLERVRLLDPSTISIPARLYECYDPLMRSPMLLTQDTAVSSAARWSGTKRYDDPTGCVLSPQTTNVTRTSLSGQGYAGKESAMTLSHAVAVPPIRWSVTAKAW